VLAFFIYLIYHFVLIFFLTFCQAFSEPNALSLNLGSIKAVFAIVSLNSRFTGLFAISSNILLISIWAGEVLELFINLSNTNFNPLTIFRGGPVVDAWETVV
jgi:hypothetical protein